MYDQEVTLLLPTGSLNIMSDTDSVVALVDVS